MDNMQIRKWIHGWLIGLASRVYRQRVMTPVQTLIESPDLSQLTYSEIVDLQRVLERELGRRGILKPYF